MSDLDQGIRSFADGLAVQIDDAVLRDHVADQSARGDDTGPRIQQWDDAGDRAILGRRGQSDDRLPALRSRRATQEIHLTANTAVEPCPDRVRANLAGEVNLECRIDRNHVVVSRNQKRIICVSSGMKLKYRIVAHKIKKI